MASPYTLTNADLQFLGSSGQSFNIFLAFLNPIAITTNWVDLNVDAHGNPMPPPNVDTAAQRIAPYAPVANLGSHRIGFVGEPLYFDGTRSCQRFDLPVVSSSWSVTGDATVELFNNVSQMAATWPNPGLYTVALTVYDRAGTPATGTRQVMIYQDRQHALPGVIQLGGPQGSLSSGGGWQVQVNTVSSQVTLFPPDALPVGTYQPAVLLVETSWEVTPGVWVNRTVGPSGQFNPGSFYQDPRILFSGYIQTGSVHEDVDKDTLSFTMVGPQVILNDAQAHLIGYYNTTYTGIVNGIPTGCNPSSAGKGFLVGGLMTADVVQSVLQYHSNFAAYHDLHQWVAGIPAQPYLPTAPNAYYDNVYLTLSTTEGTLWQNLTDLVQNDFSVLYCDRDGSLKVGPSPNMRGSEFWAAPTLLGGAVAGEFLNLALDLGYTVPSGLADLPAGLPILPALPMPVQFVHPQGPGVLPVPYQSPFQQGGAEPRLVIQQGNLTGPPVVCGFSDIPIPDQDGTPPNQAQPNVLFPWVINTWPQDLAIYPSAVDISEQYTGKASLVKLIGTLAQSQSEMVSWYPQTAFLIGGDGSSTLQTTVLPAGNWVVSQQYVLPDVTNTLNRNLLANYWWEMARRYYYQQNINYTVSVTLGMCTYLSLGDIVAITTQNNTLGPHWTGKLFYVDGLSYSLDLTNRTWTTQASLIEITTAQLTAIQPPPAGVPIQG